MNYINLKIPEHSYFFGFAQTDGSLSKSSRNRGKFQIEIGKKDLHILKSFKTLFPSVYSSIKARNRDTNFKKNYTSFVLTINDINFREEIDKLGVPYGKKSEIIVPPNFAFKERDYIRGLIDGDGSIGMRLKKFPFISFTVKSEKLKDYLVGVVERITGERKRLNRNARDNIYNIMINREKAQKIAEYLYYSDCLALNRKLKDVKKILK
jgi:DNA-binding transcriptional regulator WhiA